MYQTDGLQCNRLYSGKMSRLGDTEKMYHLYVYNEGCFICIVLHFELFMSKINPKL